MKYFKQIIWASGIWLVLFLLDYLIELFQITKTSTVITFTGLKMNTTLTSSEIYTLFSPTLRILWTYLIFVCLWLACYRLFRYGK